MARECATSPLPGGGGGGGHRPHGICNQGCLRKSLRITASSLARSAPGQAARPSQSSDDTSASVRQLDLLLTPNVAPPSNSRILRLILPRRRSLDAAGGHDICEAGAARNLVKRSGGDEVRDILRVFAPRPVSNGGTEPRWKLPCATGRASTCWERVALTETHARPSLGVRRRGPVQRHAIPLERLRPPTTEENTC